MDLVTALRLDIGATPPPVISFTGGGGKTRTMIRLADELVSRRLRVVATATTRMAAYEVAAKPGAVLVDGPALPMDEISRALDEHGRCLLVMREIVDDGMRKYRGVTPTMVDDLAGHAAALGIGAIVVEADGSRMLPLKAPAEHEPQVPAATTLLVPVAGMDALGRRIQVAAVHRPDRIRQVLGLADDGDECVTPARIARLLLHPQGGRKGLTPAARFMPLLNKSEGMPARAGARIAAHLLAAQSVPSLVTSTGCAECEAVQERWGPIAAVVLAAGSSTRLGRPKQTLEVDGVPLVVRAALCAQEADVEALIVVTGAYAGETEACLTGAFGDGTRQVRIVHNDAWQAGQATSLHAALDALDENVQAVIFLPVDQPLLSPVLLRRLIRRWRKGHALAAPRVDGELRGAPALFDRALWPELLRVRGDMGGRALLRQYAGRTGAVDVDGRMLADVDTPADSAGLG